MQQDKEMSFLERMEFVRRIMVFPALTVMVFIRRRMGYRLLNPLWLCATTGIVWLIGVYSSPTRRVFESPLEWFAIASLALGLQQRAMRWKELTQGIQTHSYSSGISIFQPKRHIFFISNYHRIKRFFDPFVVMLIGWMMVVHVSVPLGYWLIFAAFALRSFEHDSFQRAVERDLDIADGLLSANTQTETVEHFEGKSSKEGEDAPVPTGVGADIKPKIRAKNR